MADPLLLRLVAQYPILSCLAENLSTLDLFHLSLTCSNAHACIRPSSTTFKALTRQSLCDGRGASQRAEYFALSELKYYRGPPASLTRGIPVEVKHWPFKCGGPDALPCMKCGVNVCEECRYQDREAFYDGLLDRFPFPDTNYEHNNFMAFCPSCDAGVEPEVQGEGHSSSICDCDTHTRWICNKCRRVEVERGRRYNRDCLRCGEGYSGTKSVPIHQDLAWLWCPCGSDIPEGTNTRCTWCLRRHRGWAEGLAMVRAAERARLFDFQQGLDPSYAICYHPDDHVRGHRNRRRNYPRFKYDGLVWSEPDRREFLGDQWGNTGGWRPDGKRGPSFFFGPDGFEGDVDANMNG